MAKKIVPQEPCLLHLGEPCDCGKPPKTRKEKPDAPTEKPVT